MSPEIVNVLLREKKFNLKMGKANSPNTLSVKLRVFESDQDNQDTTSKVNQNRYVFFNLWFQTEVESKLVNLSGGNLLIL